VGRGIGRKMGEKSGGGKEKNRKREIGKRK
jgi:hypothetical protein